MRHRLICSGLPLSTDCSRTSPWILSCETEGVRDKSTLFRDKTKNSWSFVYRLGRIRCRVFGNVSMEPRATLERVSIYNKIVKSGVSSTCWLFMQAHPWLQLQPSCNFLRFMTFEILFPLTFVCDHHLEASEVYSLEAYKNPRKNAIRFCVDFIMYLKNRATPKSSYDLESCCKT